MAEGKKSFVFYANWQEIFSELNDSDAGKLIKHVLSYVNDESPAELTGMLKMGFIPIRSQLKRDLKKWDDEKKNRSESGKLGGIKSGEVRRKQNEATLQKTKQPFDERSKMKQNEANKAVNVDVNGNVTVNVDANVNYLRCREKIYKCSISDFFKTEMQIFLDQWKMKHPPPEPDCETVLFRMEQEYVCYSFTNERHIQNAFKLVFEKIKKENVTGKFTGNQKNTHRPLTGEEHVHLDKLVNPDKYP